MVASKRKPNVGPLAAWNGGKISQLLIVYDSLFNLDWPEFAGEGIWL
jgi:hypothetical protein